MSSSIVYFQNHQGIQSETFDSNGTFTVPDLGSATTVLHVVGCGGGGGGGGGADGSNFAGGSGGGGSHPREFTIEAAPGTNFAITIGTGGAGGIAIDDTNGTDGSAGTASTFAHISFPGGNPGPMCFSSVFFSPGLTSISQ